MSLLRSENFLSELEGRLLCFTMSVVLLACVSFMFGGVCSAWQWFVPMILASCWRINSRWRTAIAFIAVLVAMWFSAPMWLDSCANCDTPAYHLPMVRLLSFGWNPITDPEAHGICATLGLDWWGMRPYHVSYCAKPAAIFSAVAYSFVRDPYALTYPLPFLLIVCVGATALRVFRNSSLVRPLMMMLVMWCFMPMYLFVDCSLMLASAGLLLTMYSDLRDGTLSYVPLVGYGFWVLNLKLPGVLAGGILFAVFALAKLWRIRDRQTLFCCVGLAFVLACASCIASFNPYGTSFRDKGHPLYPFKTVDAEKSPMVDICLAFNAVNSDAAQMGRIGTLVHAYISPRLTCAYYNWKLNRTDFAPHKLVWDYRWHDDPNAVNEPTSMMDRAIVLLTVSLMLGIGGLRILGVALALLIAAFPSAQIGFLRYQPWIYASFSLASSVMVGKVIAKRHRLDRLSRTVLLAFLFGVTAYEIASRLNGLEVVAGEIDDDPAEVYTCYKRPQPLLPEAYQMENAKYMDRKKTHSTNLILRDKQLGAFRRVTCIGDEETAGMVAASLGYYVPRTSLSEERENRGIWRTRFDRLLASRYVFLSAWTRIKGVF